ncbi:M20 family metallo-hydrolase [Komagataeibacter sp. FNDCR2]|uniref:M20 family metallo-hydrolase n=1 Tax=Komagataeibacter sp. FNDCR2 TaxID=2878682 RepID=UPI001E3B489B|nr:M20 family metallo-hydrolase [Komagataeibacter sp. FNDCR2]MCE2575210.1 M20 family metallo-hydrolase [Komagataeibacter sp. FNDCR2]
MRQSNLLVDDAALWRDLMETAAFGGTPRGGLRRLALSDEDLQVRDWFTRTCTALGCTVGHDSMGNQFARRNGSEDGLPPIMIGSHLDTQPTGGKFDGITGVLGGVALLRALHEADMRTRHPIEVVNWTNEEGARFTPPMISSGVFAGVFTEEFALAREDRDGVSMKAALEHGGYVGDEQCGAHPATAYFELHIEQGPVLEAEGRTIGVVRGVQGMRWYDVRVSGQDAHAGTTPMGMRADAMWAAARMIDAVHAVALDHGPDGLGTVGVVDCRPASSNVIPGEVMFTVDLRNPSDRVLEAMETDFRTRIAGVAAQCNVAVEIVPTWNSAAVHFDPACVDCVRESAQGLGYSMRDIVSGAGHDAAYVARILPTAMIFVPCLGGISHNEAESAEPDDITAGANVLLHAVLQADDRFDRS